MNKLTLGEKVFKISNVIFLFLLGASTLLPFINLVCVSISDPQAVQTGAVKFLPVGFDFRGYIKVANDDRMLDAYLVTIFITVVGTLMSIIMTCFMAYPLSKKDLVGGSTIMKLIVFTMIFSGGMIPAYILIKQLHLMNSLWALILPGVISPWNMIILKSFFESIPDSLEESATIDGCTEMGILFKIIMPLSLPAIATVSLFYAVPYWNTFFHAVMYINDAKKFPLQVLLRQIILVGEMNSLVDGSANPIPQETMKAASIMFATLPIMLVYPFVQKYFVQGVMIGAVKG